MTSTANPLWATETSRGASSRPRWMPRAVEFLAVGGVSFLLLPAALWLRTLFGLGASEVAVGATMFYAAHVINDPHFSVTYLLFYEDFRERAFGSSRSPSVRARYLWAGIGVPTVLACWAAWAIAAHSAQGLGWMIQLMFLLVGWHYAKQGFGVLTVLCGRRGVRFDARERRVILAHCYAAWAFAWANPARAAGEFEEKGVVYWGPAHPRWFEHASGAALALSTLALVVVLVQRYRRDRSVPVLPLSTFLATIWLWTIYTTLDPLVRYVIPALHSLQYLYFVWLLKRNQARALEGPPHFGPPPATRLTALALGALALGWLLLRGMPSLLDTTLATAFAGAPGAAHMGSTPFFAACFVIVNLHHYAMDQVIWRRDHAETRFLYATD